MTTYAFRCQECGPYDARFPIGTAPDRASCPECGGSSVRLITAPGIGRGSDPYRRAVERTTASADAPQVVSSVPGSGRRAPAVTTHPLHRRLPRP
ncbi:FmdB family zinc ribbon protein [Nakamurella sp.]|uniref:FmdB family zinc ribbon protein n=1 Tax=Nakamurella sp. TaxID=1869182 RepID=UPI003B3A8887